MTDNSEDSKPAASPPGDPAPEPDALTREPGEDQPATRGHDGPSEAATADIEERQDTQRAKKLQDGRPPADAPSY